MLRYMRTKHNTGRLEPLFYIDEEPERLLVLGIYLEVAHILGGGEMSRALGAGRRPGAWHRKYAKCMIPLPVDCVCVCVCPTRHFISPSSPLDEQFAKVEQRFIRRGGRIRRLLVPPLARIRVLPCCTIGHVHRALHTECYSIMQRICTEP